MHLIFQLTHNNIINCERLPVPDNWTGSTVCLSEQAQTIGIGNVSLCQVSSALLWRCRWSFHLHIKVRLHCAFHNVSGYSCIDTARSQTLSLVFHCSTYPEALQGVWSLWIKSMCKRWEGQIVHFTHSHCHENWSCSPIVNSTKTLQIYWYIESYHASVCNYPFAALYYIYYYIITYYIYYHSNHIWYFTVKYILCWISLRSFSLFYASVTRFSGCSFIHPLDVSCDYSLKMPEYKTQGFEFKWPNTT